MAKQPPAYYTRLGEALAGKPPPDPRFESGFAMEVLTDPARHAALRLLPTLSREELLDLVSAEPVGIYLQWRRMAPEQRALAIEVANGLGPGGAWVQTMGLQLDVHLWPGTPHPHQYWWWRQRRHNTAGGRSRRARWTRTRARWP